MTYSALVVGLGSIGMETDLGLDPERFVFSHCRALSQHPAYKLAGAVDVDERRRVSFEAHFHRPAFADVGSALRALSPEVVVIAVPTKAHGGVLREILDLGRPLAVLCEKPLSLDLVEAREIVAACDATGTRLYVNYIRHSDPGVEDVRRRISDGRIETPVKGVAWYSKGLFNNGSHFVELLGIWLGRVQGFEVVDKGRSWNADDPEPDVVLSFERGRIHFLAAREEAFSHYGVELLSPSGRLRYDAGGEVVTWQQVVENDSFPGYRMLDPTGERLPVGLDRIQWHVVDQMHADLEGRPSAVCSGRQALGVIEQLDAIRNAL